MNSLPQHARNGNAKLAAIYVRVSSREQVEGYSLDAQRRACREFCASRGHEVVAEYADEGLSARSDNLTKRPDFARLLADAEDGRFGVVVVHKMDRFARNLRITLECFERLGKARVGFASVSEPDLDYPTPQGFLFLIMLGALAEWYSRNLATETRKGWAERKQRGLYAGRLPFGAIKGPDGVPLADTRPLNLNGRSSHNHGGLMLAFERAADGATDAEVAEALNAGGYRPPASESLLPGRATDRQARHRWVGEGRTRATRVRRTLRGGAAPALAPHQASALGLSHEGFENVRAFRPRPLRRLWRVHAP
jgi:site-specific DNA recombinase